jgi:hypothetical protein
MRHSKFFIEGPLEKLSSDLLALDTTVQLGNRIVNWPLYTETASTCYEFHMQEMWTGKGILLLHILPVSSSGWAQNEDLWLCLGGADRYL